MTEREQKIAIGVGVAAGLALLYYFVWSPYSDALDAVNAQVASTSRQLADGTAAVQEQAALKHTWDQMNKNGLAVRRVDR